MDSDLAIGNWKGSQYASDSDKYLREKFTKGFSQIRKRFISEIEEDYDSPEHYDEYHDKRHSRGMIEEVKSFFLKIILFSLN